ncbi:MAG: transposase [Alphaproteobacteria bacterium]
MPRFSPKAGIDCSADRLDVHIHPLDIVFSVANAPHGWRELDRRLADAQVEIVALEASGGCEREAGRFLLEQRYSVRLLNPYRVRRFAKAAGKLAKNDRIDAAIIALFVAMIPTRPMVHHKHLDTLAELVGARAQLLDQLIVLRNQERWHRDPLACAGSTAAEPPASRPTPRRSTGASPPSSTPTSASGPRTPSCAR